MHTRKPGPQGLVFGGIMAGLMLVFALVPFLSIFIPIPLVLTYLRYGGRTAILTSVVATLMTAMFKGPIQAFLLTVPAGILPGLVFGYGLHRKLRPMTIGLIAVAVFFVGYAADYVVTRAAVLDGRDPFVVALESEQGKAYLDRMITSMEGLIEGQVPRNDNEVQVIERQRAMLSELRADPVGLTWTLLPMAVFLSGVGAAWINYMLCRWILPRFGHEVPAPTPFSHFTLPTWLVWTFALASLGSGYMNRSLLDAPWWVKVIFNVLPPLMFIFMGVGLAALYGYLRIKRGMSKPAAMGLALLPMLFGGQGTQLYVIGAMWDTIFDFRGLGHGMWKRPQENP